MQKTENNNSTTITLSANAMLRGLRQNLNEAPRDDFGGIMDLIEHHKVTFIAEIGLNHNGNMGLLFELIKQAKLADADIAKFQLGWRSGHNEINRIENREILLIQECCNYHGIQPMFSIFTDDAFELASKYNFAAYKVASRTVSENKPLVEKILNLNVRTFISLGMTEEQFPFGQKENIEYLWCKSEYPALPWNLTDLPKKFSSNNVIGYSDHSVGIEVPLMAIMRGAKVIEKHFTLDKSDTTIRDHALSATPDEFSHLVTLGRSISRNLSLGM